jgi:peroxiredoxin
MIAFSFASTAQKTFNYEIEGELKGLKNDTLYLSIMGGKDAKPERILIGGNNDKLSYKGQAAQKSIVWAQLDAKRRNLGNFTFFIDNGKIKINGSIDSLTHTRVTGTPANNDYSYMNSRVNYYYDKRSAIWAKLKEIGDSSKPEYKKAQAGIGLLMDSMEAMEKDFVTRNPNSLASGMYLLLIADKIKVYELERLYSNLSFEVKELAILAKLPSRIIAKKRSMIGSPAPEFAMKDIKGKEVKLSDYEGKYVLLDFWASWCIPCRKENPYVKAAYEKFKDKNFVIISVSVDEDGKKWQDAVAKDQLPWIHISDLKKENKVAMLYGVQPIPDNFLISPDRKIVERGLFGDGLSKTLNEVLK